MVQMSQILPTFETKSRLLLQIKLNAMPKGLKIKDADILIKKYLTENPKMNMEKLSVKIDVNSRTIYRLMRDGETNNLKLFVGLSKLLDIPYSVLLGEDISKELDLKNNKEVMRYLKELANRVDKIEKTVDPE